MRAQLLQQWIRHGVRPVALFAALAAAASTPACATSRRGLTLDALPPNVVFEVDDRTPNSRLFMALGGAALGAGLGYFASQVFRGDWDEEPGRSDVNRKAWAMVGGSVGLAIGFSFPVFGRGLPPEPSRGLPAGRFLIVAEDFRGKGADNADDVVRALHPEWLIERGVNIIGKSPGQGLKVYLDGMQLGGVRFLKDVSAEIIRSIHYLDPAAATYRWGAGHSHGVILIVAKGGGSGGPN